MRCRTNNRMSVVLSLALGLTSGPLASAAGAMPTTIRVELVGSSMDMQTNGMAIRANPSTVQPGKVTFDVINLSKELNHEMVIVRLNGAHGQLPYNRDTDEVREDRTTPLGEVSDLPPGGHGSLTLTLTPGLYMLICNQPGHYRAGMHTVFAVGR